MKLSVVIPAYNEMDNVVETIDEILDVISKEAEVDDSEIIVVDDHSTDDTYSTVISKNDDRVRCLRLSRRNGSHVALRAGLDHAAGDAVLCISCDGQDDPAALNQMLQQWKSGAQIVWALRDSRKGESVVVSLCASIFYSILHKISGKDPHAVDLSRVDFYLLDHSVVDAIKDCRERNTSLFGLLNWVGFPNAAVEYHRRNRRHGKSKWNFSSRLNLAWDWIVSFSGVPLKLVSLLGFLTAGLGFLYALYVILHSFTGRPVEGWTSIICFILVLGGLQMIVLGVLGEYLWRSVEESRKRPLYFVEKTTDTIS